MQLELDEETRVLLERILRTYIADLRMEIADTDSPAFKNGLRHEQDVLRTLVDRVSAGTA